MQAGTLNTDPTALPLREIHLPDAVGWWPPAPGWWILPILVLLAAGITWYCRILYRRRRYSAINMARKELARIKSRYTVDRDAGHCVRSVSGLLRRLCISVFPRAESAGLTGAEWLAFLQGAVQPGAGVGESRDAGQKTGDDRLQHIGRVLLEAPYRRQVAEEDVESLIGFCSSWIDAVARISHQEMRPRLSFVRQRARAYSTRVMAMLSLAGTRRRTKSGSIIASPGKKSGLARSKP